MGRDLKRIGAPFRRPEWSAVALIEESEYVSRVHGAYKLAEKKLFDHLHAELLSAEGIAHLEKRIREHMREQARARKVQPKPQAGQITKKSAELDQLRALMKSGTLSQAAAQAAIDKAEEELRAHERAVPVQEESSSRA
jgi:S-methylmethionine-dependent homocysteine/selenocysteine methylase